MAYQDMTYKDALDTDEAVAHLDRGWDLLQRGELAAARVAAEQVLKLHPDRPEGLTLYGAILLAEGEAEESLDLFRRAIDGDPEFFEAYLYAAQACVDPLGEIDEALRLCDEAAELVTNDSERTELQLIRAEAYLMNGDVDEASQAMLTVAPPPYDDHMYDLRIGRLLLEVGKSAEAIPLLTAALSDENYRIDAHYFLAAALEGEGRSQESLEHFFRVAEFDLAQPVPNWSWSKSELEQQVKSLAAQLPVPLGTVFSSRPFLILDYPAQEMIADGLDPRTPIFLAGTPATPDDEKPSAKKKKSSMPIVTAELRCVVFYQRNLERFCSSADDVLHQAIHALVHEAAVFFDLTEAEVEALHHHEAGMFHEHHPGVPHGHTVH